MKEALVDDTLIVASPDAPTSAICPQCSHPVDLRRRGTTWYWRHQPGGPLTCPAHPNHRGRGGGDITTTGEEAGRRG